MSTVTNLHIDQGAEFNRTMTVVDNNNIAVNLTTYTIAGQLRKSYTATEYISFDITKEQYVNFVMNLACQSYMKQYNAANVEDGLAMAVMAYNSSIPEPVPVPTGEVLWVMSSLAKQYHYTIKKNFLMGLIPF